MLRLLWDPATAILAIKQKRSYLIVFLTLLFNTLFLGLSVVFFSWLMMPLNKAVLVGVGTVIVVIVLSFYYGFITKLVMNGLTGSGDFFSGLTSMVYPCTAFSVGALLASLCLFWSVVLNNQIITVILSGLIALFLPMLISLSCAALLKCFKELFETNMVTGFLGFLTVVITKVILVLIIWLALLLISSGNNVLTNFGISETFIIG